MSYEHARLELANLKEKIQSLQNQLRCFPEKNLYCTKNGTRFKWYQSDGHTSSSSFEATIQRTCRNCLSMPPVALSLPFNLLPPTRPKPIPLTLKLLINSFRNFWQDRFCLFFFDFKTKWAKKVIFCFLRPFSIYFPIKKLPFGCN